MLLANMLFDKDIGIKNLPYEQYRTKLYAFVNYSTKKGETPLWWALNVIDSIPMATLSADHALAPGNPHAQVTFYQDLKKIIEQLLEHEADINMPDSLGTTPLHIMAPNIGGRTAYDLTSNEKIRNILIDRGYDRRKVLHRSFVSIFSPPLQEKPSEKSSVTHHKPGKTT